MIFGYQFNGDDSMHESSRETVNNKSVRRILSFVGKDRTHMSTALSNRFASLRFSDLFLCFDCLFVCMLVSWKRVVYLAVGAPEAVKVALKLLEAAMSVRIRLGLNPSADTCRLASLKHSEGLFAAGPLPRTPSGSSCRRCVGSAS